MDMNGGGRGSVADEMEPLSSPPSSLSDLSPQRSDLANHHLSRDTPSLGVSAPQHSAKNNPLAPPATTTTAATAAAEPKVRKKREPVVLPDGSIRERKKPGPKPKPKDPNAPVQPRKKKQKMSDAPTSAPPSTIPQESTIQVSRQPKITDLVGTVQPSASPRANNDPQHGTNPSTHVTGLATPNTPRPASSGQLFDPIRGDTIKAGHVSSRLSTASPTATHHPGRLVPSASAVTSAPVSPLPPATMKSQNPFTAPPNSLLTPRPGENQAIPAPNAMEIDKPVKKMESSSSGPASNAPTPPPTKHRAKEQPPPLPSGSGLLAGALGGLTSAPAKDGAAPGTNIWLTFPLQGQTNVTINFAREVQRKYGLEALNPRLAQRMERRRQMAAASNALEKAQGLAGSADDMSLDLSEAESNAEMGGIDDENSTGPTASKKQRKRKAEEYDRNDEFIDDTEMAWEEQALMAKDGFFVYSGPLITEADKPTIERADGTLKRGRGRGRGGTTRGDATGRGRGGGGGRGSRGGATVRKPRVTKADRAMMEQEKLEREKMAATLAAKPTTYQNTAAVS